MLCFHGYGENGKSFEFLGRHAGKEYSFYAIDLPFHGVTKWNEPGDFEAEDLEQVIEQIIGGQTCILMGYSLGGRIALSVFEYIPSRVEKLVLLAPDGLKVNGGYWLATQTWAGNKLFAFTMKHPSWFFGLLKLFNKLGLVNASIYKFVNHYIGDAEIRDLLYKRTTTLRSLRPRAKRIRELIREYAVALRLVYGRHDRIILASVGEKYIKGIEKFSTISVIASGHMVLHENHVKQILPALLH